VHLLAQDWDDEIMSASYDSARADFEFLETLAEVTDMVEIDADVWELMRAPTKAKAAEMYRGAIRMWFAEHGSDYDDAIDVCAIADRHGIDPS
jgi:hypothetical protein